MSVVVRAPKPLNPQDEDRKRGGITLSRYQELFAEFLGCPDVSGQGVFLFGPLPDYA